jgi:Pvc16 N-terminal domain
LGQTVIDHVDNLLRHLCITQVSGITDESQVRFRPPDQEWRQFVANMTVNGQPAMALNVYLVELRENKNLRSNERVRMVENGFAHDIPAPRRMDCHYLITAWSPAAQTPAVEPTVDEHRLLYDVTAQGLRRGRELE